MHDVSTQNSNQPQALQIKPGLKSWAWTMAIMLCAFDVNAARSTPPETSDAKTEAQARTDGPVGEILDRVNGGYRLINESGAAEWGDFLLGLRKAPPDPSQYSRAERALEGVPNLVKQIDEGKRRFVTAPVNVLRRFNAVFLAISTPRDKVDAEAESALFEAASDLAEFLDDANPALAESARLWQAAAYWRAGKSDRALKILRPITAAPADARIGLVSRLFRCRLLSDSGQHAAALSHCTRIADRINRWFDSESSETREAALTTVRLVQVEILEAWIGKLHDAGDATGADAVTAQLAEVRKRTPDLTGKPRLKLTATIGGLPPLKKSLISPPTTQSDDDSE